MKLLTYSDLHLEHGAPWTPPPEDAGDVLVLAGDVVNLNHFDELWPIFRAWKKPIIYVTGNHEYYTRSPMDERNREFKSWIEGYHPHVRLLFDESTTINGVNFFGGTMWTDFNGGSTRSMAYAKEGMSDFRLIRNPDRTPFRPKDSVVLHEEFVGRLRAWFDTPIPGPRVVVTHHAPCMNPNTSYRNSPLQPAFNSLDMVKVIEEYQPAVWISGHTHENMNHRIGATHVLSNQRGYPHRGSYMVSFNQPETFECRDFREDGVPTEV